MSEEITIKVAVATRTGERVDQHFSKSPSFDIYEVKDTNFKFLERRINTAAKCGCNEKPESTNFKAIIDIIRDCRFVLAFRIGNGAISYLIDNGFRAAQVDDNVENAINQLIKSGKLKTVIRRQERK